MKYHDILYTERSGIATITINRPEKYNAFRAKTVEELIDAFNRAGWNKEIGVIVLTGAGDKATRARRTERILKGKEITPAVIRRAASRAAAEIGDALNEDIHASADYRAHIIKVMAKKAVSSC